MRTQHGHAYAAELREPIAQTSVDFASLMPVADAAYAVLAQQLDYSPGGLDPRVEAVESEESALDARADHTRHGL